MARRKRLNSEPKARTDGLEHARDDMLIWLANRKHISSAQFMAGRQWQEWYETSMGIGRNAEIGMKVDASKSDFSGPMDQRMKASGELERCRQCLGDYGHRLFCAVLGERFTLRDVAQKEGLNATPNSRDINSLGFMVRRYLIDLAAFLGLQRDAA